MDNQLTKSVTVAIPTRWQEGALQIKQFCEKYAKTLGFTITLNIGGEWDSGQVWITNESSLSREEYETVDTAVQILNDNLNRPNSEPWKARSEAEATLWHQLVEMERMFNATRS